MKDIPAQFHSFRKTTLGDNLITFRVDEMYSASLDELLRERINTEFVMKLEKVDANTVLGGVVGQNTDTRDKFFKQLHAKIREYQEREGTKTEEEVKLQLKEAMQKRGISYDSTRELGIKELAVATGILKDWLMEE